MVTTTITTVEVEVETTEVEAEVATTKVDSTASETMTIEEGTITTEEMKVVNNMAHRRIVSEMKKTPIEEETTSNRDQMTIDRTMEGAKNNPFPKVQLSITNDIKITTMTLALLLVDRIKNIVHMSRMTIKEQLKVVNKEVTNFIHLEEAPREKSVSIAHSQRKRGRNAAGNS